MVQILWRKFSNKYCVHAHSLNRVQLFVTPWTVAHQVPLSMGFSKQECWSGLPFTSPGDLPDPGIQLKSPALQADFFTVWASREVILLEVDCQSLLHLFGLIGFYIGPLSALGFPGGSDGKASACNVGDLGSIPGLGRSPGEGHGNPLQYSCLENSIDRGAWWATVHVVKKSLKWLSN